MSYDPKHMDETSKASPKRFLAKLLVLCMIVGLIPTIALAAGNAATSRAQNDTYQQGGDTSSGGSSGGGSDSDSSDSSAPATAGTVSTPATSGGETTVTVEVKPSTVGGTSSVTVAAASVNNAVDAALKAAAAEGTDPVVEIKVDTPNNARSMKVTLPPAPLDKLADNSDASLSITSGVATITLDSKAVAAVASQAGKSNVTVSAGPASGLSAAQREVVGSAPVFDFSISAGKNITGFSGGSLNIAVPYTLASGQSAADVVVYYLTDRAGLEACPTTFANGEVSFTTTHLSKYVVGDASMIKEEPAFTDVKASDYFYDAVLWAVDNDVTAGTSDTTFSPSAPCTRGQIVTFLWRANGSPEPKSTVSPFTDVSSGDYFCKAVLWAVEKGITKGTSDDTFSPAAPCTRAQAMTFLYKAEGSPAAASTNDFTDVSAESYYAPAVTWAVDHGVTSGTSDTTFSPDATCTRGQIVTFLYKAMEG